MISHSSSVMLKTILSRRMPALLTRISMRPNLSMAVLTMFSPPAQVATEEAANVNGATFFISGNDIGIYAEPAVTLKITKPEGFWSIDELVKITPKELTNNWLNPMPAKPAK